MALAPVWVSWQSHNMANTIMQDNVCERDYMVREENKDRSRHQAHSQLTLMRMLSTDSTPNKLIVTH
jgi:hypothetical protein